jgi:hypothetical protein
MVGPALVLVHDTLAAVEEHRVDAVVADYLLLGTYLGAERASLPMATLIHHIYPLPAPAIPPFGLRLQPANGVRGHFRDAVLRKIFVRFYHAALPHWPCLGALRSWNIVGDST